MYKRQPQLGGNLDVNTKNILFGDSSDGSSDDTFIFGAVSDFKMYHSGDHSFIKHVGTGNFYISCDNEAQIVLRPKLNEAGIVVKPNGNVELYYDNEKMFQTNQDGATFFDSDNNFNLYFDCNGTTRGYLFVDATNGGKMAIYDNQNHPMLSATKNGAVDLYYDNNLRLSTASSGIDITGGVLFNQIDAIVGTPHNYLYGHNAGTASQRGLSIKGAEAALEILASDGGNHGGSLLIRGLNDGYGFVNDADNNRLQLFSFASSNDDFYLHGSGQNTSRRDLCFVANQDGAVELYHNGSKTFETKSGGNIALGTGAALEIKRSSAATGNLWMQFSDSGGSQKGYLGYGSGSSEVFYIVQQESANISVYIGNATRWNWNTSGHFYPQTNNQVDIGTSSNRVRNIYTMDLQLSNKGSQNDVDGTWGDYTIQEGESDLFLINKRSGKKFKFMLQEVS